MRLNLFNFYLWRQVKYTPASERRRRPTANDQCLVPQRGAAEAGQDGVEQRRGGQAQFHYEEGVR